MEDIFAVTGCTEKRAGPGSLESRPVQAKVTYQYHEPRQQLRPSWSASAPSPSWTALLDELVALHEEVCAAGRNVEENPSVGDREGEGHTPAVAIKDRLFALVGMCPCFRPSSMLFLVKRSSVKSTVGAVTGGWIEIFHLMQYGTHGRANFLWLSAIRLFGSLVQTW